MAAVAVRGFRPVSLPSAARRSTEGIVLVYHHAPPYAATVMEHVHAFRDHSKFPVWEVNVDYGFPEVLDGLSPTVLLLHYSLFGASSYQIPPRFLDWMRTVDARYRVAFFQDEHESCPQRFAFIDDYRIDCVYTLLDPPQFDVVYGRHTHGPRLVHTLTGYVSDDLVRLAAERTLPDDERSIDVGYRARSLAYYLGRGSQEKRDIGLEFLARAQGIGLRLDIAVDEDSRLYGDAWTRFLASSRAFIGVEAGVSIFDLTGEVHAGYDRLLAEDPAMTFEEMSARLLARFEDNVPYRTISPRHFEAAAFRVLQILFEGEYSGVLEPMVHYVPLRKDFSNFDDVIAIFRDPAARRAITDRAYADLIESGRYSYAAFIRSFDEVLAAAGLTPPERDEATDREIVSLLGRGTLLRRLRAAGRPHYRRAVPHRHRVALRARIDAVRAWLRRG